MKLRSKVTQNVKSSHKCEKVDSSTSSSLSSGDEHAVVDGEASELDDETDSVYVAEEREEQEEPNYDVDSNANEEDEGEALRENTTDEEEVAAADLLHGHLSLSEKEEGSFSDEDMTLYHSSMEDCNVTNATETGEMSGSSIAATPLTFKDVEKGDMISYHVPETNTTEIDRLLSREGKANRSQEVLVECGGAGIDGEEIRQHTSYSGFE